MGGWDDGSYQLLSSQCPCVKGEHTRNRGILHCPYIGGGWGNSRGHVLVGDVKFQGQFVRLG